VVIRVPTGFTLVTMGRPALAARVRAATSFLDSQARKCRPDFRRMLYDAGGVDEKAIRRAALMTLRRAIL
jgi:hypothetical protein